MKAITGKDSCVLVNENELNSSKVTSFTALISGADEVFCLFSGTAEFVGSFGGQQSVSLLVNKHEMIRYLNLVDTPWMRGNSIAEGDTIGKAHKKKYLGFEYCTQWKGDSKYPVRMCGRLFYKQNPMDILNGIYVPPKDIALVEDFVPANATVEFTEDQVNEWLPSGEIKVGDPVPEATIYNLLIGNGE